MIPAQTTQKLNAVTSSLLMAYRATASAPDPTNNRALSVFFARFGHDAANARLVLTELVAAIGLGARRRPRLYSVCCPKVSADELSILTLLATACHENTHHELQVRAVSLVHMEALAHLFRPLKELAGLCQLHSIPIVGAGRNVPPKRPAPLRLVA